MDLALPPPRIHTQTTIVARNELQPRQPTLSPAEANLRPHTDMWLCPAHSHWSGSLGSSTPVDGTGDTQNLLKTVKTRGPFRADTLVAPLRV